MDTIIVFTGIPFEDLRAISFIGKAFMLIGILTMTFFISLVLTKELRK